MSLKTEMFLKACVVSLAITSVAILVFAPLDHIGLCVLCGAIGSGSGVFWGHIANVVVQDANK